MQVSSLGAPVAVSLPLPHGLGNEHSPAQFVETCRTPCTLYAPQGGVSFNAGGGAARIGMYDILVPPGGVAVTLRASSRAVFHAGLPLLVTGLVGSLVGFAVAADVASRWYFHPPAYRFDEFIALGFSAASLGAAAVGILLMVQNGEPRILEAHALRHPDGALDTGFAPPLLPPPRRRHWAVAGIGFGLLSVSYAVAAFAALLEGGLGGLPHASDGYIPIVGPVVVAQVNTFRQTCGGSCTGLWEFGLADAVMQAGALAMIVYGVLNLPTAPRPRRFSNWMLAPVASATSAGVAIQGIW